ncbi:hypothetical protein F5878DRAFT_693348 [Lentinula raphanica]|uniref:Uncharacterized protein n=1 Tax=Lentinula raphanica TaxID=153919 RepID=A0AA38UNE4_9AGAR|nr:hypothetical protein F5878DRAFT_693348 [Lentinula raphanica]
MLPNSPRPKLGGLPSGPRSRSIGPSRQQNARRSESQTESVALSPRHVRPQRSLVSLTDGTLSTQPTPSLPDSRSGRGWQRKYNPQSPLSDDSTQSRRSQDSSITSSSVSSIFDRVKNGAASYASSLTSVEDNSNGLDPKDLRGRRQQRALSREPDTSLDRERTDTGIGDGGTVWNRVTAAASTLTISVSKAWAANVSIFSGEETPPGQESRLTRAMKAYHIEKARDPSELPAFLFAEHERQPRKRTPPQEVPPRRTRGHAEQSGARLYRAPESAFTLDRSVNPDTAPDNNMMPSKQVPKGSDRLKALREAKRSQNPTPSYVRVDADPIVPPPRPRVGLPSTPGPRRR